MRNSMLQIAAGLVVVTAVLVAGTAAAAGTSGASTSATTIKVRIHLKGKLAARAGIDRGRFTLSGTTYARVVRLAISDRGTFVHWTGRAPHGAVPAAAPWALKLRGAKGTIWVRRDVGAAWAPRQPWNSGSTRWRIAKGTGAYDGLRGRGRAWGKPGDLMDVTMIGTVYR